MQINQNFASLKDSYLFIEIAHRVADYKDAHPDADIIRLGIGDVTRPLAKPVIDAMAKAVAEQADPATFRGYGPEHGYLFLREAIQGYYRSHGVALDVSEVFVSDGAKSDIGNFIELFGPENTVLMPDPVYPAYVDANLMAGRPISYVKGTRENG